MGCIMGTREYALQQNHGLRASPPVFGHYCLDALGDLFGGVRPQVVCTDHNGDQLGMDSIDLSLRKPPEHAFGTIAGYSEVESVELAVSRFPDWLSPALPTVRNRVPVKNQLNGSGDRMGPIIVALNASKPIEPRERIGRRVLPRRERGQHRHRPDRRILSCENLGREQQGSREATGDHAAAKRVAGLNFRNGGIQITDWHFL